MKLTRTQLWELHQGRTVTITVPLRKPADGAPQGKCPHLPGRSYVAYAPAIPHEDPEKAIKRATVTVRVMQPLTRLDDGWEAVVTAGAVMPPRMMKRTPGPPSMHKGETVDQYRRRIAGQDDYTTSSAAAMRGEPEAVSGWEASRQEGDARTMERLRLDHERSHAIQDLEAALDRVHADGNLSTTGARYARRIRLDLARLRAEMKAA